LREGETIMLDTTNPSVLSYVRKGGTGHPSILVVMNFTGNTEIVSFDGQKDLIPGKASTLLASDISLAHQTSLNGIALPAYAVWIASLE